MHEYLVDTLSVRGVPRVLLSGLVSRLPLGMTSVAFVLFAREEGYSYAVAGAALAALGCGNAAIAPIQGTLIDRVGQFRVLAVTAYGQGVVLLLFALAPPVGVAATFIVLAGVIGVLVPPTTACVRALLPATITDVDKGTGYTPSTRWLRS